MDDVAQRRMSSHTYGKHNLLYLDLRFPRIFASMRLVE
jgi:hypothetical protein